MSLFIPITVIIIISILPPFYDTSLCIDDAKAVEGYFGLQFVSTITDTSNSFFGQYIPHDLFRVLRHPPGGLVLDKDHWFPLSTLRKADQDYSVDFRDALQDWVKKVIEAFIIQKDSLDSFVAFEIMEVDSGEDNHPIIRKVAQEEPPQKKKK